MATTVVKRQNGREVEWKRKVVRVRNNGKLVAEYRLQSERQAEKFFIVLAEMRP